MWSAMYCSIYYSKNCPNIHGACLYIYLCLCMNVCVYCMLSLVGLTRLLAFPWRRSLHLYYPCIDVSMHVECTLSPSLSLSLSLYLSLALSLSHTLPLSHTLTFYLPLSHSLTLSLTFTKLLCLTRLLAFFFSFYLIWILHPLMGAAVYFTPADSY